IGHVARIGPEVRVLVTSQIPLRVGGEHVLALDPLATPTGSERELSVLRAVPSVALLVDRATAAGTGWTLSAENQFEVARLCRQLEGMPLALELAAPRLRVLDAHSLSHRLDESLDALGRARDVPARQRGLLAVLDCSFALLSETERSVLVRLSVFSAGFTAELAQAAFGDVLDELQALVLAGLVRPGDRGRFDVQPPVRRFAAELLDAEGEDAAHAAITDALVALAEPFEKRWVACVGEGRRALDPEAGNILAELDWAQLMDYGRHIRLAASTGWWMNESGAAEFARDHLEIALARTTDLVTQAQCLQALGVVGLQDPDPTESLDAADIWHDLGDAEGEFYSAIHGARLYGHEQDGAREMEVVTRCAELTASLPDDPDTGWILQTVRAEAEGLLGHPEEAIDPLLALLPEAASGSWKQLSIATRVGDLELVAHRYESALGHYGVALEVLAGLGTPLDELIQATTIAVALVHLRRVEDAATTWAICELGYDELSWSPYGVLHEWYEAVRADLDDEHLAAGRRRAAQLGVEGGLAWVGQVARGGA
ncbi:MAG: ATP-binding protein, partial [Solirubrobacteraceae bacterium]